MDCFSVFIGNDRKLYRRSIVTIRTARAFISTCAGPTVREGKPSLYAESTEQQYLSSSGWNHQSCGHLALEWNYGSSNGETLCKLQILAKAKLVKFNAASGKRTLILS